jgi:hypothetical protein
MPITDEDLNQDPAVDSEPPPAPNGHAEHTDDPLDFIEQRDAADRALLAKVRDELAGLDTKRERLHAIERRLQLALGTPAAQVGKVTIVPQEPLRAETLADIRAPGLASTTPRKRGRPAGAKNEPKAVAAPKPAKEPKAAKPKKLSQADRVLAYVEAHPGCLNAAIGKDTGIPNVSALTNRLKRGKALRNGKAKGGGVGWWVVSA